MRIHDFITSVFKTAGKNHSDVYWPQWKKEFIASHLENIDILLFYIIPILYYSNSTNIEWIFPIALQQSICEKHVTFGNAEQRK